MFHLPISLFESFVNSERCKTHQAMRNSLARLRALLIQKDVKRVKYCFATETGLRALLIQKDVKPLSPFRLSPCRLRALLIQKDVKLHTFINHIVIA